MYRGQQIIALVPARSGSKGIPDKNIVSFRGKPLLAHSILQAHESELIDAVYLSTDSERYAEIGRRFGARVPFLRPAEIAADDSTDFEVFEHFLGHLRATGDPLPEVFVHLRPTYPTRSVAELDAAIRRFVDHLGEADSLRSVIAAPATPFKMWRLEGEFLEPLVPLSGVAEPYNAPRQALPPIFFQNACIDIVKRATLESKRSMTGDRILAFKMDDRERHDVDRLADLEALEDANRGEKR